MFNSYCLPKMQRKIKHECKRHTSLWWDTNEERDIKKEEEEVCGETLANTLKEGYYKVIKWKCYGHSGSKDKLRHLTVVFWFSAGNILHVQLIMQLNKCFCMWPLETWDRHIFSQNIFFCFFSFFQRISICPVSVMSFSSLWLT